MKQEKFSSEESLELISQMIRQTRQGMKVGSGNTFLYYGYSAGIVSLLVFAMCTLTGAMQWHALWFLMFVPMLIDLVTDKQRKPDVVSYIDKAVGNVWRVIAQLICISVAVTVVCSYLEGQISTMLMMPLCLLYVGIGVSATGIITNERLMMCAPLPAYVVSIYMLTQLVTGDMPQVMWNLLCGAAFVIMLVIPGHVINRKMSKSCSKN